MVAILREFNFNNTGCEQINFLLKNHILKLSKKH
jgi:hypothetical protein